MESQKSYGRLAKDLMFQELKSLFDKNEDFFVVQEERLTVEEVRTLKGSLRETAARYFVVKNSICRRILQEESLEGAMDFIQGPTAIVLSPADPIPAAKVLVGFAKAHETFKIRGGLLGGQKLDFSAVQTLASLPSREVLIAKAVVGIKSPIVGLVLTLSALLREVVTVVERIREKKE